MESKIELGRGVKSQLGDGDIEIEVEIEIEIEVEIEIVFLSVRVVIMWWPITCDINDRPELARVS